MDQRAKNVNAAAGYCVGVFGLACIVFIAVCTVIVPGIIVGWRAEGITHSTAGMRLMIDAADSGRHNWFIVYPVLGLFTVRGFLLARRVMKM